MAYEVEDMSPIKVGIPSPRRLQFNEISNDELRRWEHDFLNEMRNESEIKLAIYQ